MAVNNSSMNNGYIAYFDLLGTRGFCEEAELYFKNITAFNDAIEHLSLVLKDNGSVGVFSDCAYAESNDLSYLLEFMIALRSELNAQGLFFNAVVKKGRLGIEASSSRTENTTFGVKFTQSSIASLYIDQTNFKGVGIKLDEKILAEIDVNRFSVVDCIYVSSKEENHTKVYFPVGYKDIAYKPNGKWEETEGIELLLKRFFTTLYSAYVKAPKFGAYYISALVNMIRSYSRDLIWNTSDKKIETTSVVFKSVECMLRTKYNDLADLPGIEYLALVLLDEVYKSNNLDYADKKAITKDFISMDCIKKKYIHSLNDIPQVLFSGNPDTGDSNRNLFISFCQADLSSDFVDDIMNPKESK